MSDLLVVDSSVAIKWVIAEPYSDNARALYRDHAGLEQNLVAPSLFANEVVNAIYRQFRRGNLSEALADAAVDDVAKLVEDGVELHAPADLPRAAYRFAKRHQLGAIYDSMYVILAQRLGADLWTADERLVNAVGGTAPWVRWIGDYGEERGAGSED